jgi:spore coat polysaccharide biosynthesis predicted glycosyltransferase SpsG/GNAT superfamily N-acetyltransferase
MRILMHCNSGPELGVGHAVRSVALAEQALTMGHEVTFVGVLEGDLVRRQLARLGVGVIDVPSVADVDAAVARAVADRGPDVVHIDSYDTGQHVAGARADGGRHLLSRVEDGPFGRSGADVVVDPNFGAERVPRGPDDSKLLLRGSRYAPLRAAVTDRRGAWQLREHVRRVLVVMGGTDPHGLTPRVLDLLGRTGMPLEVTAVVGSGACKPCGSAAEAHPCLSVALVPPVDDLPGLMVESDVVVSAAGTSVWELCCLGVPMALVLAVDNQRVGYDRVVATGAAAGLGAGDELHTDAAADLLRAVLADQGVRRQLSAHARSVVDGRGAWRVVAAWGQLVERFRGSDGNEMSSSPPVNRWSVRRATMADARRLMDWRNDPATRAVSRRSAEVTWEDHVAWLKSSMLRDDRLLLVAEDGHGPVGTVRWDRVADHEWEVSITVAPPRRGQGLARRLLAAGEQCLSEVAGGPVWCLAAVHVSNPASRRLFTGSGYAPEAPPDADGFEQYAKFRPGPS